MTFSRLYLVAVVFTTYDLVNIFMDFSIVLLVVQLVAVPYELLLLIHTFSVLPLQLKKLR